MAFFSLREKDLRRKCKMNPGTSKDLDQAESGLGVEVTGALQELRPWGGGALRRWALRKQSTSRLSLRKLGL